MQRRSLARPLSMFEGHQVFEEPTLSKKAANCLAGKGVAGKDSRPKTRGKSGKGPQSLANVSSAAMTAAIDSLYADELKPYGRILKKRLAEQGANNGKEVELGQLRRLCESDSSLRVASEEGGEWVAVCVDRDEPFIDVYNKEDPFSEDVWEAAAAYFETMSGAEDVLPGGRYACAQTLHSRKLPFLEGLTLGRICHFVQLALATRKVLGYRNGGITSYRNSQSYVKDSAASHLESCAQAAIVSSLKIASWEDARRCLKRILRESLASGEDQVPLSNIKRICRAKFETELSETALGHSRLSEFLQDTRLADICTVKLLDQGYFVIPQFDLAEGSDSEAASESSVFNFDESLLLDLEEVAQEVCNTPLWPESVPSIVPSASVGMSMWLPGSPRAEMVHNTFIHAPATPLAQMSRRCNSVPRNVGVCRSPLVRPYMSGRSPMTTSLTPISVSSPFDYGLPQTPDQWAMDTPAASPYLHALDSVPETQPVESEKFTWADEAISNSPFGCSLDDFPPVEIDLQAIPASPSPFACREAPLLAGIAAPPVALCLSNCV